MFNSEAKFFMTFSKKTANLQKEIFDSVQIKNEYLAEPINVLISRKNTLQKHGYRDSRQKKLIQIQIFGAGQSKNKNLT